MVRRAAEHGLPVLFDAYSPWDANQPGKFVNLAMEVPESRLILAHAHGPGFPQLLFYDMLARYPWWRRNVWIDISVTGPLLAGGPFADQFAWVLRKVGVDRVVFGSDYPLDDPLAAAGAVAQLGFTDEEQAAILHDNAAALLGQRSNPPAVADQDLEAAAVHGRGEALHRPEAEGRHHPQRPGVEARHGHPEGVRREPFPPELEPGGDHGPAEAAPGQLRPQPAAGVKRGVVVRPAGYLPVGTE